MTPTQKAKELVEKYNQLFNGLGFDLANDCALIAVDEMLLIFKGLHKPEYTTFDIYKPYNYTLENITGNLNGYEIEEYYEQVKQEIINL